MKPNLAKLLDEGFRTKHNHMNKYTIYTKGDVIVFYDPVEDNIDKRNDLKEIRKGMYGEGYLNKKDG